MVFWQKGLKVPQVPLDCQVKLDLKVKKVKEDYKERKEKKVKLQHKRDFGSSIDHFHIHVLSEIIVV